MQRKSIFIPHCLFIISTMHCVLQSIHTCPRYYIIDYKQPISNGSSQKQIALTKDWLGLEMGICQLFFELFTQIVYNNTFVPGILL